MTKAKPANPFPSKKKGHDQSRRLNLTFSTSDMVSTIRQGAKEDDMTPSEYVELIVNKAFTTDGKFTPFPNVVDYVNQPRPGVTTPRELAEYRLTKLLTLALGAHHPAIDDLACLVLHARPPVIRVDTAIAESTRKELIQSLKNTPTRLEAIGDFIDNSMVTKGGIRIGRANTEEVLNLGDKSVDIPQQIGQTINAMDTTQPPPVARMATPAEADTLHTRMAELKAEDSKPGSMLRKMVGTLASIVRTQNGNQHADINALLEQSFAFAVDGEIPRPGSHVKVVTKLQSIAKSSVLCDEEGCSIPGDHTHSENPSSAREDNPLTILREIQGHYTRDDDLPNDLLPRIDKMLELDHIIMSNDEYAIMQSKSDILKELHGIVKAERPDLSTERITHILRGALRYSKPASPREKRKVADESLEAQFHQALVRSRKFDKTQQGYIMGAYREGVIAHMQNLNSAAATAELRDAWEPTVSGSKKVRPVNESRNSQTHQIKCHPEPFEMTLLNDKKAEFRVDDGRDYRVGDRLLLCEWSPETEDYTGRNIERFVTHIQTGYGIPPGYVVMSYIDAKTKREDAYPDADKLLRELMAIMHRDGGHYVAKHGMDKAVAFAIAQMYADRAVLEGRRLRPFTEMWEMYSKRHGMHYGEDALSGVRVGYQMVEEAIQEAYWTEPVYQPPVVRTTVFRHLGFIILNAEETEFMKWGDSGPEWTTNRDDALRFARREDAELVSAESEEAWKIKPFEDTADLRQGLGEKLSEVLGEMDEAKSMDWFDARNVDIVLDAIMPIVTGEIAP